MRKCLYQILWGICLGYIGQGPLRGPDLFETYSHDHTWGSPKALGMHYCLHNEYQVPS